MGVCERKNIRSVSEADMVQNAKGGFGVLKVLEISLETGNVMWGIHRVSVSGQAPQWSQDRVGSTKDREGAVPGALASVLVKSETRWGQWGRQ